MQQAEAVRVPNIGDFAGVEVIDVLVQVGDVIKPEDPLITLESDKATIDIPAPAAGKITEIKIQVGDKVSEGDLILMLEPDLQQAEEPAIAPEPAAAAGEDGEEQTREVAATETRPRAGEIHAEVLVLGSGPGGYTAAFRAADLGKKTLLVERYPTLGGVCLNVGCIPSKALLHSAKVISEAQEATAFGIDFGQPQIDIGKLRSWKDKVVMQLTNGLKGLARQRKVEVLQGEGSFLGPNRLRVETVSGERVVVFEQAIIAAGSRAVMLPDLPQDERIMDSTSALQLTDIPGRLLVIGGGIIGLELATVYHQLGARVTVVEMLDTLMAGADADIVKPLHKRIQKQYENIYLGTGVTGVKAGRDGLQVSFAGPGAPPQDTFDRILVAVGRRPNGHAIGADLAGVAVDERGFVPVDRQQRTNIPHIFAIGDVVGQPMLAHKAAHEGRVAAEVAAGMKSGFDARVIPSVAYTDPEVAWVGVTEHDAAVKGIRYGKGVFPWAASGRSLSIGRNEGLTKLLFDEETGRVIGAGICGTGAGDLIAEAALAIEMGCDAHDIGLTVHPHPTLSETVAFAAEVFTGTITDLYVPKK
jgi:dihydrolipoamide dehydrogenase